MEPNFPYNKIHHGRNIRRLREILGIKQEGVALELCISQQAMSKLEQKDEIDDEILEKVSKVLGIPVNSIKNFNDNAAVNIIANTFNNSSFVGYKSIFNPVEKIVEFYERILKLEQEKNALLEKMIREKISPS